MYVWSLGRVVSFVRQGQLLYLRVCAKEDCYNWCCHIRYMPRIPVFVLYLLRLLSGRGLWPDNLYFALSDRATHSEIECDMSVAYPGILFGGSSTNSVEDRGQRERGSGCGSPILRGCRGSCNLVQEISFHIVKFS